MGEVPSLRGERGGRGIPMQKQGQLLFVYPPPYTIFTLA